MAEKIKCVVCGAAPLRRSYETVPLVYPAGTVEYAPVCRACAKRVLHVQVEVYRNPHLRVHLHPVYLPPRFPRWLFKAPESAPGAEGAAAADKPYEKPQAANPQTVVEVVLTGSGVINPSQLFELLVRVAEKVPPGGSEPVVLSGRLPVWVYAALAHYFHPRPWVGTFEPRLGKAVVVASHVTYVNIGDVVELEGHRKVIVTFP
jgi:CRISPR-associated Csx3 family protein